MQLSWFLHMNQLPHKYFPLYSMLIVTFFIRLVHNISLSPYTANLTEVPLFTKSLAQSVCRHGVLCKLQCTSFSCFFFFVCVYLQEIQHRLKRHRNYVVVSRTLESMYVQVPPHELFMSDEVCAICWEKMNTACRLPCGHHFHM